MQPKFFHGFTQEMLYIKTTQSPAAENEVTPDPGPVSAKF